MKFLFASDSFKGSLSSEQTAVLLAKAAHEVFPSCETDALAAADGGEGTTDALLSACGGEKILVKVHGPRMALTPAFFGRLENGTAIVEMAAASGLALIPVPERDPLLTSSFGTGELIKAALDAGCTGLAAAIGGSATNDGGMGCMRALGVRFLDRDGHELEGRGIDLERVERIDVSGLDPRLQETEVTVMCDVTNPLCGPDGASFTFGPQKGGTPESLLRLEAGMQHYCRVLNRTFHADADAITGGGAAGGLGAALALFMNGHLQPGIQTVLDLIHFDSHLDGVSLVVTGEGRADASSQKGKVMQGVARRCREHDIPVVGLVGSMEDSAAGLTEDGISSLMTTVNAPMTVEQAMEDAGKLYYGAAVRMFRLLKTGMAL